MAEYSSFHPVLFAVSGAALWRRLSSFSQPRGPWGKVKRETWMEVLVCLAESALWVLLMILSSSSSLRPISEGAVYNDYEMLMYEALSTKGVFTLSFIGAFGTLVDIDRDTVFDTMRRALGIYYCLVISKSVPESFPTILCAGVAVMCAILPLAYRVKFGMGVADSVASWGFQPMNSENVCTNPISARKLNVLVLSVGTRGDVQPFVYLGTEMQARGHHVTICALERYRGLVERHGIRFQTAGIDNIEESKFWRRSQHVSEIMADSIPNFCANFLKIGQALYDAATGSSADVMVVTSSALSIALSISEKLNIPTFVVKFAPDVPTRSFPAPGYEGARTLRTSLIPNCTYNLFSWYHHWVRIGIATVKCKMGLVEERYRKEVLNLPKLKGGARLKEMLECPNLCAFSEVVLPTPRDWPGNCLITGWWLPNDAFRLSHMPYAPSSPSSASTSCESVHSASCSPSNDMQRQQNTIGLSAAVQKELETISNDVLRFLGKAKDVICVTFGSMSPTADAVGLVPMVIKACEDVFGESVKILIVGGRFQKYASIVDVGCNDVFTTSEEDLVLLNEPIPKPRIMVIDEAPYHLLFPLVRLVVHHGGAGTSASTIQACVPSLVIPILLWTDQPLWACQLEAIGMGFHVEQRFVLYPEHEDEFPGRLDLPPRSAMEEKFYHDCIMALRRLAVTSESSLEQKRRESVARTVARERGVEKAVDAIEYYLSKGQGL